MKLTKARLKQIIKEERQKLQQRGTDDMAWDLIEPILRKLDRLAKIKDSADPETYEKVLMHTWQKLNNSLGEIGRHDVLGTRTWKHVLSSTGRRYEFPYLPPRRKGHSGRAEAPTGLPALFEPTSFISGPSGFLKTAGQKVLQKAASSIGTAGAGQLYESEFMSYLTKPMFVKDPPAPREEEEKAQSLVLETIDEIEEMIENLPPNLEGMIKTLRDIKEKLSNVLIWGDNPLLDLIEK
jgi:hypothetical protein